ncbi:cbb3-type cytochrome c oxidase N-terminal domain-containing protein [Tenacibaculum agarivorans]|uniref:cbb3-type cytochrome c oxidase N-terminal domain-containing protein n=1 Tax=Tenacibaculum agarivorans TaxID=1908389 RepID=UPI00094B946A|nr:cbb3-type cytochrome c oxidase N-terminal domain-containing protein [Tenacibaculum agarivorans]
MKRIFQSIIYLLFVFVSFWILIKAITSYENPFSLYENPLVWILLIFLILVIIAKEYFSYTVYKMTEELQLEKKGIVPSEVEDEWELWIKNVFKKFTRSKTIEEEEEIILDHNYDGIKELDNVLPPWWVYLFYATIVFGVIYLIRFHIAGGDTQEMEFEKAMTKARYEIEQYKAATPNTFDIENVALLTEDDAIARGKAVFNLNCASCHAPDGGGGIGPNLTDEYWILGGGFDNVFNTVYNGGRAGKGMVPWKGVLKPQDIQKVASFIISLEGTTPAKPKKSQGEIWVKE